MSNQRNPLSRRSLLKSTLALAGMQALPLRGAGFGGRALICIYLFGGHDSNNMLVPLSTYDGYAAARGPLAIPKDRLLPVTSRLDGTPYGFHPALAEIASLFEMGQVAVAANIGNPAGPVTPDPYLSYFTTGYPAPGWAAQMAGITEQTRDKLFTGFPNLLPNGGKTCQLTLIAPGVTADKSQRDAVMQAAQRSSDGWQERFPQTGLGQELRQVASLISSAGSLGMNRQVFLVSLGGFGTNTADLSLQSGLYRELSTALAAFNAALREIGAESNVTTYTDSEFSRTLRPNAKGFSGAAWGGHQIVMGAAVLGGSVYGNFPAPVLGSQPHDREARGIFQPTASKEQYYATLANWFGLSYADMSQYFPETRMSTRRTLGFMVTG